MPTVIMTRDDTRLRIRNAPETLRLNTCFTGNGLFFVRLATVVDRPMPSRMSVGQKKEKKKEIEKISGISNQRIEGGRKGGRKDERRDCCVVCFCLV